MIKAYPINSKGEQIGPVKTFSDSHWFRMTQTFGKNLAFRTVNQEAIRTIKEVELLAQAPLDVSTKKAKRKK